MTEKKHTLVFATRNTGKIAEIRSMLPAWIELKSLDDIQCTEELPETGDTLAANALEKAYHVFSKYGLDCFAEDSGLEVEALNGAPGVYSARYAGEHGDSEQNMDLLLQNMQGQMNRKACFRTVICLIYNGKKWSFDGRVDGEIMQERTGAGGFGYDPIFRPDGQKQTFAHMDAAQKNSISHRAIAFRKLLDYLADREEGLSWKGQGEYA